MATLKRTLKVGDRIRFNKNALAWARGLDFRVTVIGENYVAADAETAEGRACYIAPWDHVERNAHSRPVVESILKGFLNM